MRLVLAECVHAGERRDAERRNLIAQEDAHAHVHHRLGAWMNVELIRTARARRIEQCVHGQHPSIGRGPHDPELGEAREFLALASRRVDGEAAGREAIPKALRPARGSSSRRGTRRARPCTADRSSGNARGNRRIPDRPTLLGRQLVLAVVEVRSSGRRMWRTPLAAFGRHLVDAHRIDLELADVKEHHLERQFFRTPQRVIGTEADVAILIVGERRELCGWLAIGGLVWLACLLFPPSRRRRRSRTPRRLDLPHSGPTPERPRNR